MSVVRALFGDVIPAMAQPRRSAEAGMQAWPSALLAWALMLVLAACLTVRYYTAVDYEWMRTLLLGQASSIGSVPANARDALDRFLTPAVMAPLATFGMAFQQMLTLAALWGYLRLVSVFAGTRVSSTGCLGAAAIVLLPATLDYAGALAMSFVDPIATLPFERLNPLSADALWFRVSEQSAWQKPLAALSITQAWSVAILLFWLRGPLRLTWLGSVVLALAPFVAFFSVWAFFIATMSST